MIFVAFSDIVIIMRVRVTQASLEGEHTHVRPTKTKHIVGQQ